MKQIEQSRQSTLDYWQEFLGTKKRTAATHYGLKRKCSRCDRYITNNNLTGLCYDCTKSGVVYNEQSKGESEGHKVLKCRAEDWLKEQGATNIKQEKHLSSLVGRVRADVYGVLNGEDVIIECGGSQLRKLQHLLSMRARIFIWPYNFTQPYEYTTECKVCALCGNKL